MEAFMILFLITAAYVIDNVDEIDCAIRGRIWQKQQRRNRRKAQ